MFNLFFEGGPLFMGILTLLLILVIIAGIRGLIQYQNEHLSPAELRRSLGIVRQIGLLAFIIGILGQLIGLYDAFVAIQQMDGVSPAMLAGGLKVSMITTIYGALIWMISMILSLVIGTRIR